MTQKWKLEPTARWLRAYLGGEKVADSQQALLMIEAPYLLVYYFPKQDVRMELLTPSDHTEKSGYKGTALFYTLKAGGKTADNAAWTYPETLPDRPDLSEYIAFAWNALDEWYEEDEQVFVHPRNPYHRVDTIPSSRHIKVVIGGEVIAESHRPALLFETGLPTRYYLPEEDVRIELLTATDSHTHCPYKGQASYWNADVNGRVYKDIVWSYPDPIPETPKIKGLLSFYNEKVDIYVDGFLTERPRTEWS